LSSQIVWTEFLHAEEVPQIPAFNVADSACSSGSCPPEVCRCENVWVARPVEMTAARSEPVLDNSCFDGSPLNTSSPERGPLRPEILFGTL
jgi:hypothetical protein